MGTSPQWLESQAQSARPGHPGSSPFTPASTHTFGATILRIHPCPSPPMTPNARLGGTKSGSCTWALRPCRGPREGAHTCARLSRAAPWGHPALLALGDDQPRVHGSPPGRARAQSAPLPTRPTPTRHSCALVMPWWTAEDRPCKLATHHMKPSDFCRLNYADGFSGL